jgi:hypothetical protein
LPVLIKIEYKSKKLKGGREKEERFQRRKGKKKERQTDSGRRGMEQTDGFEAKK